MGWVMREFDTEGVSGGVISVVDVPFVHGQIVAVEVSV